MREFSSTISLDCFALIDLYRDECVNAVRARSYIAARCMVRERERQRRVALTRTVAKLGRAEVGTILKPSAF